ncbi:hypothetical protein Sjap_012528 [Stephania japonica]|uniref:Uncharacterized protein n=1 Tax=Stephania japonica TaxID=461633 RepID=A0AAP0IYM1_9MAGN
MQEYHMMVELLSNFKILNQRLAAGRTVEKVGVSTSEPVSMAHDLLLVGHRYLDVRYCNIWFDSTRQEGVSSLSCEVSERICSFDLIFRTLEEFSVGHAVGAVNVPYMLKVVDGKCYYPNKLDQSMLGWAA